MTKSEYNKLPKASLIPFEDRDVVLVQSKEQYIDLLKYLKITDDDEDYDCKGFLFSPYISTAPRIIAVFDLGKQTLVHELCHLGFQICNHIHYDPRKEDEPFCYFLDHLYGKLAPFIKE